jgi:transcriptional regulator with XRE-family HTH domain
MANSTKDIFRQNLKFYRNKLNLTQEKLSELSGISSDYLSEIERGKRTPSFKRLDLIASALDLEVYKLFIPQEAQ